MQRNGLVKVTVNLPTEQVESINTMAADVGVTKTEVIRRALVTERFVFDTLRKGEKILVERADGSLRQVEFR